MAARIEMLSTVPGKGRQSRKGTLRLAKKAALDCLRKAQIEAGDIDLLIYAGIYRDDHIGEPSIASLIQKEIGANPNLYPLNKRTFSFDLNAGACGLVNSFQLIDGFISTGKISRGMVITGDSEPVKGLSEGFNYRSSASGIILVGSDNDLGFQHIKTYSYPQYADSFRSYISWKRKKGRVRNRNILVVEQKESYLSRCVECSYDSLKLFLNETGLQISDIDLIIPSQSPAGFVPELEKAMGKPGISVEVNNSLRGELHTSGPAFALRDVWGNGLFHKASRVLFLTVGAGISTAIALYENKSPDRR